jgi:hypothetical protein
MVGGENQLKGIFETSDKKKETMEGHEGSNTGPVAFKQPVLSMTNA